MAKNQKIKVEAFLHMLAPARGDKTPTYMLFPSDMSEYGYALIGKRVIELDMEPDFDPRPSLVKGLRQKQSAVRAQAEREANAIEDRIQQILALEYKPEVVAAEG